MMNDSDFSDATFQAQMAVLRRHYVDGLPGRRSVLAEAWQACVDGGDEAAWLRLRDAVHKLSGSAPSYGFEALGGSARELDELLSGRPPCRQRALAEALVMRVERLLDVAMSSD